MPWNAKAPGLLREQYGRVGGAAKVALSASLKAVRQAEARGMAVVDLAEALGSKLEDSARYAKAYLHYCWEVTGLEGVKLAPFHFLATEGKTYFECDHEWHVAILSRLADHSEIIMATESRTVSLGEGTKGTSETRVTAWWNEYTEAGGEGMVVKPLGFVARGPKGIVQPGVKVRGREYLRIIYGPEYTEAQDLDRL